MNTVLIRVQSPNENRVQHAKGTLVNTEDWKEAG